MKLLEDSAQKLRYCETRNLPRVGIMPGAYYDLPCLYPIAAIVLIIILAIMPLLSALIFWIVFGTLLAWIATIIFMAWREDWKRQYREYFFQVDKAKQVFYFISTNNAGKETIRQYSREKIKRLFLDDSGHRFLIRMDIESTSGGFSETLGEFKSKTERDACLEALGQALELPVEKYNYSDC